METSTKYILGIIAGILVVLGVLVFAFKPATETATLPLVFEEYSDFECPACAVYYPAVNVIIENFGEDVDFDYKHFPLQSIHPRAYSAAVAAEAAGEQGKFKEMHDVIFENQDALEDQDLENYASQIGLDVEKFLDDYNNSQDIRDRVDADIAEGQSKGVNSTPSFFVNGVRIRPNGPDDLINRIGQLIEDAKAEQAVE